MKSVSLIILSIVTSVGLYAEELKWVGCGISKKAYVTEMVKAFEAESGVKINVTGGGATKGIREVAAGNAHIGGSCRHTIVDAAEKGVKLVPVGWDAIVAIVHPDNPVSDISAGDLQKVFKGEITNWKDLGGSDAKIDVFTRKSKRSGVGLMARELLFADPSLDFTGSTEAFKSTGPLEKKLLKTPTAIALTGISSAVRRDVKILSLSGFAPNVENISSGEYKLFRPLYLVHSSKPSPDVVKFMKFVLSPKGQTIMADQGTVTLAQGKKLWGPYRKNMKAFTQDGKGVFQ